MNNTVFYLIGHSESGRLDVARAISALVGARIVDSQAIYEPIFNLIDHQHPAEMPDAVWAQVDAVREAILTTAERLSPPEWNFVFTHAGYDIPPDVGVYRRIRQTAERRGARFQPVRLAGGASHRPLLSFDEASAIVTDLGRTTPADAARMIVAAAT